MRIKISKNKYIGDNFPVFIVAEISANHGQNFDRAVKMIKKAKECGADAVKFQAYTPDTMTIDSNNKYFQIKHPVWGGQTLYELYKKAYTPWGWFKELKKVADKESIFFFSTAFDKTSVDFLDDLGVSVHKIASFELTDIPLIKYAASKKKPLIISTGMGSDSEIKTAIKTAKTKGAKDILVLKCVSNYPAGIDEMNLREIPEMKKKYNCLVGLSDHSLGVNIASAAVSLGSVFIEKHFVLSKKHKTPDSHFSIDPSELKQLSSSIREVEKALGNKQGIMRKDEKSKVFRRSIFVVEDVKKGEIVTEKNIRVIRPSNGLDPKYYDSVVSKKFTRSIKKGIPLKRGMIK